MWVWMIFLCYDVIFAFETKSAVWKNMGIVLKGPSLARPNGSVVILSKTNANYCFIFVYYEGKFEFEKNMEALTSICQRKCYKYKLNKVNMLRKAIYHVFKLEFETNLECIGKFFTHENSRKRVIVSNIKKLRTITSYYRHMKANLS